MSEQRIQQLLEYNNRELDRRRAAEKRNTELELTNTLLQHELLTMIRALGNLLEGVRNVKDEIANDGDGHVDCWQSIGLKNTIDAGDAVMKKYCKARGI